MKLRIWILSFLAVALVAGIILTSAKDILKSARVEIASGGERATTIDRAAKNIGLIAGSVQSFPALGISKNQSGSSELVASDDFPPTASEIQSAIGAETTSLQKCLIQEWRRTGQTTQAGHSSFSFSVLNDGKLADVKILKSTNADGVRLQQCWAQVLTRVRLRPFLGEKLVVSEFPIEIRE